MNLLLDATTSTVRHLRGRLVRQLARRLLATPAAALPEALRAWWPPARAAIVAAVRDPAHRLRAFGDPGTAALIETLPPSPWPAWAARRFLQATGQVLLELARAAALPDRGVRWPAPAAPLVSVRGRLRLRRPPGARWWVFGPGRVTAGPAPNETASLDAANAPVPWLDRPFAPVAEPIVLALADVNPLASLEAHPDKAGSQLDLGGRPVQAWTEALAAACALVAEALPEVWAEMQHLLVQIVPVGFDAERHLSASYFEAVGTAYVSLHPRVETLMEALVHEFQHSKLNAAMHLDPLLHDGDVPRYRSPVRPDLRPMRGVLLAAHAFVPVAEAWIRLRRAGHPVARGPAALRHIEAVVACNAQACATLAQAQPTEAGRALLAAIEAAHARHQGALAALTGRG